MAKIIYILSDSDKFKKLYKDSWKLYYDNYKNVISASCRNINHIEYVTLNEKSIFPTGIDLLIVDDEIDVIIEFIISAQKCDLVNNILVIDDLVTMNKYIMYGYTKPKLATLDFLFSGLIDPSQSEGMDSTLHSYTLLKKQWTDTPVLGISNHLKAPEASTLKSTLRSFGDELYDKLTSIEALPYIIENRIEANRLSQFTKGNSTSLELDELVLSINKKFVQRGINLETEKKVSKIKRLLDVQEQILNFVVRHSISYKSTSLAAAMIYIDNNKNFELNELFFNRVNKGTKDNYKAYNLPDQPLAFVQKYFRVFDENGIITKDALILIELFRENPDGWPTSLSLAKNRDKNSYSFVTFLDNIALLI